MAALDYLRRAGLTVEAVDGKLRASPVELITPELRHYLRAHKVELLAELAAANDPQPPRAWLHLLALADGCVIQLTSEPPHANVERDARLRYGNALLVVVAVPGFRRPLTDAEIVKALAGTLIAPATAPAPSTLWLARVARLLAMRPAELLEAGHLEQHDIAEMGGTDTDMVADTIRRSPAWINRPELPHC